MTRTVKITLWVCGAVVAIGTVAGVWLTKTRGALMKDIALDIKAGVGARHAEKPFNRFIELRYGPMTEATNRQKAFTGFFDPAHIQGMRRLVAHMNESERQMNIAATADWIGHYRTNMTAAERESLAAWLASDAGREDMQKASALYRSHDIAYRHATEAVIRELMVTLAMLREEGGAK